MIVLISCTATSPFFIIFLLILMIFLIKPSHVSLDPFIIGFEQAIHAWKIKTRDDTRNKLDYELQDEPISQGL